MDEKWLSTFCFLLGLIQADIFGVCECVSMISLYAMVFFIINAVSPLHDLVLLVCFCAFNKNNEP